MMQEKGHEILFTCRDKEFEIELLSAFRFSFKSFGKKYASRVGKLWGLVEFDVKEFLAGLSFNPDILLSHGSIYAAHAAFSLRKPHISFEDTYNFEQIRLYLPFSQVVLTGNYAHPSLGKKEIKYAGYHELAYLHPNYFIPDETVLDFLGVKKNEKYVILRFVAWKATHDYGHKGITYFNKLRVMREFERYAKVFISSESALPDDLVKYRIKIPPDKIHDALAFSCLLFGESSTMAEEGAMLGVPSIYLDKKGTCYTNHLENDYELIYNFNESESDQKKAIEKGIELLNADVRDEWKKRRDKMLADKIDVTAFLVWLIENYPDSTQIMRKDPDYQWRFK